MLISFNKIGNIPIQIALAFKQLYNKFTPNNISAVIGTEQSNLLSNKFQLLDLKFSFTYFSPTDER